MCVHKICSRCPVNSRLLVVKFLGCQVIHRFLTACVWASLTPALFRGQLYCQRDLQTVCSTSHSSKPCTRVPFSTFINRMLQSSERENNYTLISVSCFKCKIEHIIMCLLKNFPESWKFSSVAVWGKKGEVSYKAHELHS